jgi:hypothetical protein
MPKSKPPYPVEFKREAVRLVEAGRRPRRCVSGSGAVHGRSVTGQDTDDADRRCELLGGGDHEPSVSWPVIGSIPSRPESLL